MKIERARILRKKMTESERKLWRHLRSSQMNGLKFRRQHPIGPFIVDFVCLEKKLVLELDGSQHMTNREYDASRTTWLNERGYKVIRFWDNDVFKNFSGIVHRIFENL